MDVEKTIEFLLNNQAAADARLSRIEAIVAANTAFVEAHVADVAADNKVIKDLVASNARDIRDLASLVGTLAQSMIDSGKRFDEQHRKLVEQDRKLGQRIDALVSGVGEFIRRSA